MNRKDCEPASRTDLRFFARATRIRLFNSTPIAEDQAFMKPFPLLLVLKFAFLCLGYSEERPNGDRPNDDRPDGDRPSIIIILVDDMGFSDLGCYGGEIPTPHIDSLAENGLRFSQFYNTGRCCPTRASLLTGLYSHRAGVGHMTNARKARGYIGRLNEECTTIGQLASDAGYLSAVSGKWHVGSAKRAWWPLARGFDRFYGCPEGGGFYHRPKDGRTIVLNEDVILDHKSEIPDDWYCTDSFTENGLRFVDEAIEKDQPFFLYLAHIAPHFPLQADEADIAKYRGKFLAGWDKLSQERHQRQIELGFIDPAWEKMPRPKEVPAWDSLNKKQQDRLDHLFATYAATMDRLDRSIGNLIDGLKERDQFDNTLILFLSDNGASAEGGTLGRTDGDPTEANSNWWAGKAWAWHSNTPFRRYKKANEEGGIATPLIAHWPAGISDPGTWREDPFHVIDILPTILDLTEASYPEEVQGNQIAPFQGQSFAFALKGITSKPRKVNYFWEHEGNAAVRDGDWKLVRVGGKGKWELYDLKADRTEQNNLASTHADQVTEMTSQWEEWAKHNFVAPRGNTGK